LLQVTAYIHIDSNNQFLVKRWTDLETNSTKDQVEFVR
jgi:dolichyl-phosphate-mannose--protein O-mannosyl transferase